MKSLRTSVLQFGLLALAIAGCNSILDNKPGQLKQSTDVEGNQPEQPDPNSSSSSGSNPLPSSSSSSSSSSTSGAVTVTPPPTPPSSTGECTPDKVLCNGQCVGKDDPAYGCGTCKAACTVTHGTAACAAGACVVKVCDKGYSDCNAKPADGCETDLSKAASCGACNATCGAAAPVCAPSGGSFQCGTGCTGTAPLLCGTECVDPLSSKNHCGGCGAKCPDVPNGETTCAIGACGFTCHPGFNKCGGACKAANDVTACGPTCAVCPAAANAIPTCAADACGFTCSATFADCNAQPGDGCEVNTATDPLHCGGCNLPCNGTCSNGVCTPTPPPDPDAGAP